MEETVLERRPGDVHRLVRVVIEFQQVREQKGLCYSIYSYGTCHDNTGYFGVYTALGRETEGQVLDEDAIIAAYDAVTRADVQALAGELFRFENASLSAVGRVGSADAYRALLH